MRKALTVSLIVAAIALIIGVIFSFVALASIGFDLKLLDTSETMHGEYTIAENFSSININVAENDVRLKLSEDDVCRVEYASKEDVFVKVENGVLCVETGNRSLSFFTIFSDQQYIDIYLSSGAYDSLSVDTSSGDIYVFPAFDRVNNAVLSSASGDISFIGTVTDTLAVSSTSGDILIREPNAKIVRTSATSGEITLSGVYATEVFVKTTSGDIELDTVTAKEKLTVESTSGDIELYCDAAAIFLKSISGDIEGSIGSAKNYIIDTVSGSVRIPPIDKTAGVCEIYTTSGDIKIKTAKDAVNSFDHDN